MFRFFTFAAAVQYAVRTGATLFWGQTRALGFVGYTTVAELIAVDAQIRSAVPAGQLAPTPATCVAHRRISPDGTVVEVKADGTEQAPRDAVMARLGEILANADPHAEG